MKMITLLFLFILSSCATKYEKFDVIEKRSFTYGEKHSVVAPKMIPGKKESRKSCAGQFLFFSNAKKTTDEDLKRTVQYMCFGSDYLLNSRIEETFWTTILYSRSCVEIEAICPYVKKEN